MTRFAYYTGLLLSGLLLGVSAQAQPEDPANTAYQSALQALQQQRWTDAELWLERTLMYQPNHAEALLQLALLLAQRGEHTSAQALIQALLQDPRTPPAHRARLQALLLADPVAAATPVKPHGQASLATGYGSNPLGLSSASHITLTLPAGDVTLPLQNQPRPASQTTLAVQQQWPSGAQLGASATASAAAQSQTAWSVTASLPVPSNTFALPPTAQLQASASQGLDGASRQALGAQWLATGLRWRAGYYHEPSAQRKGWYLNATTDAHNLGQALWVQSWLGYEHAQAAASPAVRASLTLQAHLSPATLVQCQTQWQQDTRGYSPLLDNNAKRQLLTSVLSLAHTWPAPGRGTWQATAYLQRRWSNLPLFAWQDQGLSLAYNLPW